MRGGALWLCRSLRRERELLLKVLASTQKGPEGLVSFGAGKALPTIRDQEQVSVRPAGKKLGSALSLGVNPDFATNLLCDLGLVTQPLLAPFLPRLNETQTCPYPRIPVPRTHSRAPCAAWHIVDPQSRVTRSAVITAAGWEQRPTCSPRLFVLLIFVLFSVNAEHIHGPRAHMLFLFPLYRWGD